MWAAPAVPVPYIKCICGLWSRGHEAGSAAQEGTRAWAVMAASARARSAHVHTAQVKSYLSGNPGIALALNDSLAIGRREGAGQGAYGGRGMGGDAVMLDDCNFHQSVSLDRQAPQIFLFRPLACSDPAALRGVVDAQLSEPLLLNRLQAVHAPVLAEAACAMLAWCMAQEHGMLCSCCLRCATHARWQTGGFLHMLFMGFSAQRVSRVWLAAARFETERTLQLVPPNGEFAVMNYRSTYPFKPPFRVSCTVDEDPNSTMKVGRARICRLMWPAAAQLCGVGTRAERTRASRSGLCRRMQAIISIRVVADFGADKAASGLEVAVPMPKEVRARTTAAQGPSPSGVSCKPAAVAACVPGEAVSCMVRTSCHSHLCRLILARCAT